MALKLAGRSSSKLRTMKMLLFATVGLLAPLWCNQAESQQVVDQWRYRLRQPGKNWNRVDFNDSKWREATGGLGTLHTPGARIGTIWRTNNIWLRKHYDLSELPETPALLIHHDEDAEVFINGKLAKKLTGFTKDYEVVPLDPEAAPLTEGENVLAVHCRNQVRGQFIDVHLIDATQRPELPELEPPTKPFDTQLTTVWGKEVTPENAWTEYPRPLLERKEWQNLNGDWDYAITQRGQKALPADWQGKILVPFCLESSLGGVQRLLDSTEALWYRRSFNIKAAGESKTLLNFEAVDYRCEVFVNGKSVGTHVGGNTPFSLDVTEVVHAGSNELIVRVEDDTEAWQLRGKQVLEPRGIWYTRVSGIWQTVWLEQVPSSYLADIKIATDANNGTITVTPTIENRGSSAKLRVVVRDAGKVVAKGATIGDSVRIEVSDAKLWSPQSPHLYDLTVQLLDELGEVVDTAESYAGIRSVGKTRGDDGHLRFTLNGEVIFHWGTLDQGWWPDGLLTPPSDEAMLFDIEWLKQAGFNMIRKHIKVEPRRYYYHCDRVGMMVWQDHVSGGLQPRWSRLEPGPLDAQWPDDRHEQFMLELDRMIDALESHPSIVMWVPFNERWGQHRTMEVGKWAVERDPSRLVNIASGGNFWPIGDVVDAHKYPHPGFPFDHGIGGRFDGYVKVVGEFGGHGYPVQGHIWDAETRNWGYGGLPRDETEYRERYTHSIHELEKLRNQGIAAGVYTQTTDVEGEINGLMTYDRKVAKIAPEELAELHEMFVGNQQASETVEPIARYRSIKTDREPGEVLNADEIRAGLESHDRALYIKEGWIRDPYITLGPDDYYYLTGTQPNPQDPKEAADPYNTGLGVKSLVGEYVRLWRSKDLIEWEYLGEPFGLEDAVQSRKSEKSTSLRVLWAPEVHWLGDRWALVHCPKYVASLAVSEGPELKGPWTHPMGRSLGQRHDPSLFQDDDGSLYLLWANTMVAPLSDDLSRYTGEPVRIDPAGSRPGPDGKPISRIGHEGATMIKVGDKYVHLGTAWSTDIGRHGSYNLYYCVSDNIAGPYGPRKFAGRFLGHGTPFQTRDGKWWCTAFFNGNVPPLPREGIEERDLSETAQTINEQGVTIVPLEVRLLPDGDVYIRAKDPAYAVPGPDEAQQFDTTSPR